MRCSAAVDAAVFRHKAADLALRPCTDIDYTEMLQPLTALTALAVHGRMAGVVAEDPSYLSHMPLLRSLGMQQAKVQVGLHGATDSRQAIMVDGDCGETPNFL